MIITLKRNVSREETRRLTAWLEGFGVRAQAFEGVYQTVIGLIGDTSAIDADRIAALPPVAAVTRVTEPCRLAGRAAHPQDTVLTVGTDTRIGGGHFQLIAGPCAVESEAQITAVAQSVRKSGAGLLRGGAFKPRTSPYDFQGLGETGLRLLTEAGRAFHMPVVSEITDPRQLPLFEAVDVMQVGARNMQNYELLRELGRLNKPVLLKRGLSATLRELLLSVEYILAGGNGQVMLCERGIRCGEGSTRATLDISAVPVLKELTHLPVIVDPSHAAGAARFVRPLALAAAACGADGVMIEVHNDPPAALCDGPQALTPEQFDETARAVRTVRRALGAD